MNKKSEGMWRRNDGKSETEVLQNRFSAYVTTAVRRQRKEYLQTKNVVQATEQYLDYELFEPLYRQEEQVFEKLPILMQLEDNVLLYALKKLSDRERYLFVSHALDEKDFCELASEYGMHYKGIATAYYRIIRKIKRLMKEAGN